MKARARISFITAAFVAAIAVGCATQQPCDLTKPACKCGTAYACVKPGDCAKPAACTCKTCACKPCQCAKQGACAKPACVKKPSPSIRQSNLPYKLGFAGYTFTRKTIDETLAIMQRIDAHYLCIKPNFIDYMKGAEAPIAEFKAKCAAAGVECLGAGPLYYDNEADARKIFEFAKAYGIKMVVVVPFENNPKWKKGMPGREKRLESDRMIDVLEKLCKEFDICAAIHNHGPDNAYLYPTAEASLKRIGNRDRRVGVCLDVGHERRAGLDPVDFIRKHGDRIYDIHLKNIQIDPVKNFAKEGPRGELDIPGILTALAEVGYTGVCHIEYEKDFEDNLAEVAESFGYYRGVMDTIRVKAKMQPVPAGANTLTAKEKAEGWELLFDGRNLPADKWVGTKKEWDFRTFPGRGWFVKDGCLTMRPVNGIANGKWFPLPPEDQKLGGGGDIVTKKTYRDFMFKFDFRLTEAANSGIKYFYDENANKGTCEEYQVLDAAHPDSTKGLNGNRRVAALYDLIPANAEKYVKPIGQWNSGMVVSRGKHVEHWLNGVKVLEYERGSKAFRDAVDASKYATWGTEGRRWGELEKGRLLIQDHHDSTVSYCNLKVKEL